MKKVLFTIIATFVLAAASIAQATDTVTLKVGKEAKARHSRLKIRFVEVSEDSRCPERVSCVWAGNARVKFEVTSRGGATKTFEANTGVGPKGDQYDGWAIELVSLTPLPTTKGKPEPKRYSATFTITRLQR